MRKLLLRLLTFLRRRRRPDKIMYIGGSDTLPPPLPRDQEAELLARLDQGELPVRQTLIERNLRLVVYIARRFENTGINIEDLISIGTIGLIKAVNTFRADKGIRLATYASRCIENAILSQRNNRRLRWRKSHEPFWGKMVYVLLLRFQVLHGGVYQFQLLLRGAGQLPDIFQRLTGLELCQLPCKLLLCLR